MNDEITELFILKFLINRLLKLKITLTNQFIISVTNKSLYLISKKKKDQSFSLSLIFLLKKFTFCIYKKDICNLICCLNLN